MKRFNFLLTIIAVGLLGGCGPEKSELDLERERADQRISQKAGEIAAIAGVYSGTAQLNGQEVCKFNLSLTQVYDNSATNPDSPDVIVVGAAELFVNGSAVPISFPSVRYYHTQNLIVMVGTFLVQNSQKAYFNFFRNGPKGFSGQLTSTQFIPLPNTDVKTTSLDIVMEKVK